MSNLNGSPFNELNDYKKKNYVCQRIQLKSPLIHIGVGAASSLNIFEYVQGNKSIYFPNQTALAEALQNPKALQKIKALQRFTKKQNSRSDFLEQYENLSEQYINIIERNPRNKDEEIKKIVDKLTRLYAEALGEDWLDNKTIFPQTHISANWVNHLLISDIAPMIRNGFGKIYIPGSSIKGAIRTAIAYYLLKHKVPTIRSEIEHRLNEIISPGYKNKNFWNNERSFEKILKPKVSLNSYLFTHFKLEHQNQLFGKVNTANTDFMRAIKVSDSDPIKIDRKQKINLPIVAEVLTSSFHESSGKRKVQERATNYLEMIFNFQAELFICIDTAMLDKFQHEQGMQLPCKLKTVKGILDICQEFAQAQWEHEQKYWNSITDSANLNFSSVRQFYANPCSYNLRLGWGTGMTGTTVGLLFQEVEVTRAKIRNACGKPTNSTEAPKSRRTATIPNRGSSIQKPLGWVKLEPV